MKETAVTTNVKETTVKNLLITLQIYNLEKTQKQK